MENTEPFFTVGGNANWCSHYGKQYGNSLKVKTRTTLNPAIIFLCIYLKEMKILTWKDIYTPITAFFIIAKTWKQPKYPSMDRWIKKLCVCVCVQVCARTHTQTHRILLKNKKEGNRHLWHHRWTFRALC